MTNEEAIKCLKNRRMCAECVDSEYCDSVDLEAIKIAIDALEKQIPKPLDRKKIFLRYIDKNIECPQCPVCGNDYGGTLCNGCNYCDICGQRLDWSEEDDELGETQTKI